MANEENLKPFTSNQDREEAKKNGIKGGIASGEVRRKKKQFLDAVKWLANSDIKITKGTTFDIYKNNNIDISKLDPTQLATLGLWMGAVQGRAENYKTLVEANGELVTSEEKIAPTLQIELVDNSNLEKTLYEENKHSEDVNK